MVRNCLLGVLVTSIATSVFADEKTTFDTSWLPSKPEVLTYSLSGTQGDGMLQVSSTRSSAGIEININVISPGFSKTVFGEMDLNLKPSKSKTRMLVDGQVGMVTDCDYSLGGMHIATLMSPYNQKLERTFKSEEQIIDFSQTSLLVRTLKLIPGAEFRFTSVNPKSNTLTPLIIRVASEETILKVPCYKIELRDFEGRSLLWVEKGSTHRVLRTEKEDGTITELIQ